MGHYFADTEFAGALEMTKIMIPLGGHDSVKDSSFPAQEVPLMTSGTWAPRSLDVPREIGRYVDFLRKQSRHYLGEGNPQKAVKRAFSLARVLFLDDDAEALLQVIRGSGLLARSAIAARANFARQLSEHYSEAEDGVCYQRTLETALAMYEGFRPAGAPSPAGATPDDVIEALSLWADDEERKVVPLLTRLLDELDGRISSAVH